MYRTYYPPSALTFSSPTLTSVQNFTSTLALMRYC